MSEIFKGLLFLHGHIYDPSILHSAPRKDPIRPDATAPATATRHRARARAPESKIVGGAISPAC
jgi:hypothetical protein